MGDYKGMCKPFGFAVRVPPNKDDLHISPSLFAVESEAKRDRWMVAFSKFAFFSETKMETNSIVTKEKFIGLAMPTTPRAPRTPSKQSHRTIIGTAKAKPR